jgi:hypothetical protein
VNHRRTMLNQVCGQKVPTSFAGNADTVTYDWTDETVKEAGD